MNLIALLAAAVLPACAQPSDATRTSTSTAAMASEQYRPAAEATGRSELFELNLSILKTKVKPFEFLLYKVSLKNVSDRKEIIWDRAFRFPFAFWNDRYTGNALRFRVIGPDGQEVRFMHPRYLNMKLYPERGPDEKYEPESGRIFNPGDVAHSRPGVWRKEYKFASEGGYTELPFYFIDEPGKYRIQAIYGSGEFRTETSWIVFEVGY